MQGPDWRDRGGFHAFPDREWAAAGSVTAKIWRIEPPFDGYRSLWHPSNYSQCHRLDDRTRQGGRRIPPFGDAPLICGTCDGATRQKIPTGEGRRAGEVLHPEREPLKLLQALRRDVGESIFSAQHQQDPMPADGTMVKRRWLQHYTPDARPDRFDSVFQSWDTANKLIDGSDFSVCTTWGIVDRKLYVLDVLRDKDAIDAWRAIGFLLCVASAWNDRKGAVVPAALPDLLEEKANRVTASALLVELIRAAPNKIHTILTDNGVQFRLSLRYANGPTAQYLTDMFEMRAVKTASNIASPGSITPGPTARSSQ